MMRSFTANALLLGSTLLLRHAESQTLDAAAAAAAFAEAKTISALDGGKLWGRPLYGPIVFVDPSTNAAFANEPDPQGMFHKTGNVWQGKLPDNIPVANTAFDWQGVRWTMVQWPLPQITIARHRLLAHEMFHRIEPPLGIPTKDAVNAQLDSKEGRIWIFLEWRALASALSAQSKTAKDEAVSDAMLFRHQRQQLFEGSFEQERALELNEGLAEYTGVMLSEPDEHSADWRAIAKLADPNSTQSLVRSFAYTSGPAYGLLLDERFPGWRKKINASSDLATLLSETVAKSDHSSSERSKIYGSEALQVQEAERQGSLDALRDRYRKLLVVGPTLTLPISDNLNFSFDPGELTPLDDEGTVYPSLHATDEWGSLEATQGALVSFPKKILRVAAPSVLTGASVSGPGWQLKLTDGWALQPKADGSFTLRKK